MTVTLESLKSQLDHYMQQRANNQQVFHQICGAIAILEEMIAKFNSEEPVQESMGNGQIIEQSTEQVTQE